MNGQSFEAINPGLVKIYSALGIDDSQIQGATDRYHQLIQVCSLLAEKLHITLQFPKEKAYDNSPELSLEYRLESWFDAVSVSSNIRIRKIQLPENWWKDDFGIIIGFYKNEPCLLSPNKSKKYLLTTSSGKTLLVKQNLADIENYGFLFTKPLPEKINSLFRLTKFSFATVFSSIKAIFITQIILSGLMLFLPIIMGYFFDNIAAFAGTNLLFQLSIILCVNTLIYIVLSINQALLINFTRFKMEAQLSSAMWDRILKLPLQFFRRFQSGDIAFRTGAITAIQEVLSQSAILSLFSWIMAILAITLMMLYDFRLAIFALIGFIVFAIILFVLNKGLLVAQRKGQEHLSKQAGFVFQVVTGIMKFKVAAAEFRAFNLWSTHFSNVLKFKYQAGKFQMAISVISGLILIIMSMLLFSLYYYQENRISVGHFIAFNTAFAQLYTILISTSLLFSAFMHVIPWFEKSLEILEAKIEKIEKPSDDLALIGNITIKNLSFRYNPNQPLVYKNLNMNIIKGQKIGITGESGCGKSTLFQLLIGIEKPNKGQIYYDGVNMDMLNINALRQQIGIVSQKSRLIPGTILENIIGNNKALTPADAWDIVCQLGFEEMIKALPMQMETYISEGMQSLSGGEMQRIILARALISKPKILLFDEATSALDNEIQAKVQTYLRNLNATQIIIAHRLNTLRYVDNIFVISKGLIIQSGDFNTLLSQPGYFAELAKYQYIKKTI